MPRVKQTAKVKEPIRLRMKELANGNKSLYLDIYRDGKRTYEYLKMYLIPETDNNARVRNQTTMAAANAIKSKRIIQLTNGEAGIETRETVLGYIQRGGSPTPFDRNLSTRMGGHATELIAGGQFGRMVTLKGNEISSAPLGEIAGKLKLVTEDHDLVVQGKRMGICFG